MADNVNYTKDIVVTTGGGGPSKLLMFVIVLLLLAFVPVGVFALKQQQDNRTQAQVIKTPGPTPDPTVDPGTPAPTPAKTPGSTTDPQPSCTPIIGVNLFPKIECPTCVGGMPSVTQPR